MYYSETIEKARNPKEHRLLPGVDDDDYLGFLDTHFELTRFKELGGD